MNSLEQQIAALLALKEPRDMTTCITWSPTLKQIIRTLLTENAGLQRKMDAGEVDAKTQLLAAEQMEGWLRQEIKDLNARWNKTMAELDERKRLNRLAKAIQQYDSAKE